MNERGHLSAETLDLLLLGSLAGKEAASAQTHLSACGACKSRWTELTQDRQQFEQFVFPRTLPQIQERRRSLFEQLRARWQWVMPALGMVAAGVIAVVVVPKISTRPYLALKGRAPVEVVAQRGAAQFPVKAESRLRPGDQIRFVVEPAGAKYLLIASRDSRGAVTFYFPYDASESAPIGPSQQQLPGSIELDNALGPERLFAFFSDAPIRADQIRAALVADEPKLDRLGARSVVVKAFIKEAP